MGRRTWLLQLAAAATFWTTSSAPGQHTAASNMRGGPARPTLCLQPQAAVPDGADDCFASQDEIVINVEMGPSQTPINGAQFYLQYNPAKLQFLSVDPGGGTFNFQVFESVNPAMGTIDYAAGDSPTNPVGATNGPATVAVVRFASVPGACSTDGVCFRSPLTLPTRLYGTAGQMIAPACHLIDDGCQACCTGRIDINHDVPVMLNCPALGIPNGASIAVNAPCGQIGTTYSLDWPTVSAQSTCAGAAAVVCTATHYAPCSLNIQCGSGGTCGNVTPGFCDNGVALPDPRAGGDFPTGRTEIECTATNVCGRQNSCSFDIVNSGRSTVVIEAALSSVGNFDDDLVRCMGVRVESAANAAIVSTYVDATVEQDRLSTVLSLPPNYWGCLMIDDIQHALPSTCVLDCVDEYVVDPATGDTERDVYVAQFTQNPATNSTCHWLVGGDLNNDDIVDILDYVIFVSQRGTVVTTNTSCASFDPSNPPRHADINGDGVVDTRDFSFILVNFFRAAPITGCAGAAAAATIDNRPRSSVTVDELLRRGFGQSAYDADANGDGVVDLSDMAAWTNGRSRLQPSTKLRWRASSNAPISPGTIEP